MAKTQQFIKEKLICGILYQNEENFYTAKAFLLQEFGEMDYMTEPAPFAFSSYYDGEMGSGIKRVFVSFKKLYDPALLLTIKEKTNAFELKHTIDDNRQFNLDPGFISLGRLVLATTKNAGHRIVLDRGIYAEITLFYSRKAFQPLPWTYPDFRSAEVRLQMKTIRTIYHQQLKELEE